MTTPAGYRYITHRQQGFAAKDQAGNYLYRCVCGWDTGYLPEAEGKAALGQHLRNPGGAR
jgi:hypothetical protein